MTEREPQASLTLAERMEQWRARRTELQPALAALAIKARSVYEELRPSALHVFAGESDYPLRHQQVHGMDNGSVGGIVADYLIVALGKNHSLTLYQSFSHADPLRWRFTRSLPAGELFSEHMKVDERDRGDMRLEVTTFRYPERFGLNPRFVADVCGELNNYDEAEAYIDKFDQDLDRAIAL